VDEVMNPVRLLTAGLLTVALPLAAHPQDSKLRVAAAITYEETGRPQGLPEAFQPGSSATFLTITSIDGHQNNAVLWRSSKGGDSLVVSTGGSGGAYHADPLSNLGRGLSDAGTSVLSINTRQTGDRVNTDNFFDIGRDLDAAVKVARSLGYKTIVLHGHSLGNIHVQFYAATHWDSDIKGVVLTSAFADLPWKSRNMLVQDEARYLELRNIAHDYQRSGKAAERLPKEMSERLRRASGSSIVTSQHFLTYRSTEASTASGVYWIKRIPYPILLVRDEADPINTDFEPYMLLSAATSEGTLVPSIHFELLTNPNPPSYRAHMFIENREALVRTVSAWLKAGGL
jgi:pimeloyl-ACP methyl ester carboxylesterase